VTGADATAPWVERVLNRESRPSWPALADVRAAGGTWLVTGGLGSLGAAIGDVLDMAGVEYLLADIDEMDVTNEECVAGVLGEMRPDVVLHLAGAKHAPEGELDPMNCVEVNTIGTRNVLRHAGAARVVTASTCKACDPETAYGASKLIAERLTLNAGQRVARFHNVVETSGNVFELWREQAPDTPLLVADCSRYFISRDEALALLLHAATQPRTGRWSVNPQRPQRMADVAARLYPGRATVTVIRRGDRTCEPLCASNEHAAHAVGTRGLLRVYNTHDPVIACSSQAAA
jgi:FlaA1/EpsC-like NDP-sugar epimerase